MARRRQRRRDGSRVATLTDGEWTGRRVTFEHNPATSSTVTDAKPAAGTPTT